MTDFEKSIKRGMTREKFVEIRDHKYGDGGYFFNYTYGDVSSFLTWNRDENDKNEIKKLKKDRFTKGKNINDGEIHNWDQKKLERITVNIVFVGLNMSADGKPLTSNPKFPESKPEDFWFQNARRQRAIIDTFLNTEAEGAYFTDIIKTDKRILEILKEKNKKPSNGEAVKKIVLNNHDILKDHFCLFKKELKFIGAFKPLLIVFGDDAEEILNQGLKMSSIEKSDFYDNTIVKIYHYASYPKGGYEGYRNIVREQLKDYITIP
jgi:predicted secreted protein